MATAGRLVAGKSAGSIFNNSKMLTNPIVGLMLGEMRNQIIKAWKYDFCKSNYETLYYLFL